MENNPLPGPLDKLQKSIEEKNKKTLQTTIGVIVILGFFLGPYIFFNINNIITTGQYDPEEIFPVFIAIMFSIIITSGSFSGHKNIKKLMTVLQVLTMKYAFVAIEENTMSYNYQPELLILKGKFNNKEIMIWPATDPTRKKNKKSPPATLFATSVSPEWPTFTLKKNSDTNAVFGKIWGGMDYKDKYIIQFKGKTSQSKEKQLARVTTVLNDSVLYDFDNLPGKNRLESDNGLLALIHDGFIYNEEEYIPFMSAIAKVR